MRPTSPREAGFGVVRPRRLSTASTRRDDRVHRLILTASPLLIYIRLGPGLAVAPGCTDLVQFNDVLVNRLSILPVVLAVDGLKSASCSA